MPLTLVRELFSPLVILFGTAWIWEFAWNHLAARFLHVSPISMTVAGLAILFTTMTVVSFGKVPR